jgi:hypothetical protein
VKRLMTVSGVGVLVALTYTNVIADLPDNTAVSLCMACHFHSPAIVW